MNRTRPILRWPGGKSRLLAKLLPMIPKHTCYVEVFGGGGALLFGKPRSKVEVLNDINGDLISLYRTVQFHLPELMREFDCMVGSRKNLFDFMAQPGLTDIQRAARFLVRNRTSFGGNMDSFAVARKSGGGALSREFNTRILGGAHERLDRVTVENLPYDHCVRTYDSAETFFFFDPPYLGAKIKAYKGWNEDEMTAFRRMLNRVKAQWLITVDGSDFNRTLFRDFRIKRVETQNRSVNVRTHGGQMFKELIITPK